MSQGQPGKKFIRVIRLNSCNKNLNSCNKKL